jgi:hypothetical protein
MSFNFQEVEKQKRGTGYYGASVKSSGVYLTKSLIEDLGIDDARMVGLRTDPQNNAFQVTLDVENSGWYLDNSPENESGMNISAANTSQEAYERLNLPHGRYRFEEEGNDTYTFVYDPDL